jgi:hypothetical protein
VDKKFGWVKPVANDTVRNYYDKFKDVWKANDLDINDWVNNSSSSLYKKTEGESILVDSILSSISTQPSSAHTVVRDYRMLLDLVTHKDISFSARDERPLFKYIGENYFDFLSNANVSGSQSSRSPFTMIEFMPNDANTKNYFDRTHLKAGYASYTSSNFSKLKTLLSYYVSDINFWLTSDNNLTNTAYADYLHTQTGDSLLTSNSKSEIKGYFSNIMFIQNAIQRVLYPRILKSAQDGYSTNDNIFDVDASVYDTIFDSIVNNSFVYTDKNITTDVIDGNYEIIPNRVILETKGVDETIDERRDFVNYKSTNLYEFMINTLVNSKDSINDSGASKIASASDMEKYTRESLLFKGDAINYNRIDDNVVTTGDSVTISDFGDGELTYDFTFDTNTLMNPSTNNWIKKITDTFFKIRDGEYANINYRTFKFFKLPIHSEALTNSLNRNIVRVDRELLTDVTDLSNFDIEGLSLADFTYGEKALLFEYIDNFRNIKKKYDDSSFNIVKDMIKELDNLVDWKSNPTLVATNNPANSYYIQKDIYFPEFLTTNDIADIKAFLNRSILSIGKTRTSFADQSFVNQARELLMNSAVDIKYMTSGSFDNKPVVLNTIGTHFLNSVGLIITSIKSTPQYQEALFDFNEQYKTGIWADTLLTFNSIKDILLNDTYINNAISYYMYTSSKSGILKELDIALYKLMIHNYFDYLSDPAVSMQVNIFADNDNSGLIRYYKDLVLLVKFALKYYELVPLYITHLNSYVIPKYRSKINAIKSLPTWDYENFHRRDKESDLKINRGINVKDYTFVWTTTDGVGNISMIYKRSGLPSYYRLSGELYTGGLSDTSNDNSNRNKWWRKWLTNGSDVDLYGDIVTFKIPSVNVRDNNVELETSWSYNNPNASDKLTKFKNLKYIGLRPYQHGKVANINSFKYTNGVKSWTYENIGVPILLFNYDDGWDWNKPNTTRRNSFSFETEFLNLWYTDKGHNGDAYTSARELVSGADKYVNFGLGNMDIQHMFRHIWNMESTPMGNPYTVMNYDIFSAWDQGYEPNKGDFPWSTESFSLSNKYDFKFVLNSSFKEGIWSPIRISGEDRSIGVDPDVEMNQIFGSFYLTSVFTWSDNPRALRFAIFDIYNRNLRNRIYLNYMKWRFLNNRGV